MPRLRDRPAAYWLPYVLVLALGCFLLARFRLLGPGSAPWQFAVWALLIAAGAWAAGALFREAAARTGQPIREALRWTCLLGAAVLLTLPYARPERIGAGDAQDYAEHIADFIRQVKGGVFPVLVGQSHYAFNGAFNPVRTAPYLEYAGGALWALSLGRLNAFALQNLEVILSLIAAGFGAYLCLQRLAPRQPTACLLLAFLYISSPGVLALAYEGDMIPSWLTLPYLPLAIYLIVRVADEGPSLPRLVGLAVVVAAIWWAHAPIAMWLSLIAIPVVGARLVGDGLARKGTGQLLAALAAFALLAGYEFVSVAELSLPVIPAKAAAFTGGTVLAYLQESWKGFLRPVGADASDLLRDLQLSPVLWLCLAGSAAGWRRGGWSLRALLAAALGLLALLVPIPAVAGRLWAAFPAWIGQITDQWPAQRFFPILSILIPFAALLAWRSLVASRAKRPAALLLGLLAAGCAWNAAEAAKFVRRGYRIALPPELSRKALDPSNTVLSVYSYAMLGTLPRYYSYAPVTENMQLHLLDPRSLEIVDTNPRNLLQRSLGRRVWTGTLAPIPGGAILKPDLRLQPGSNYLLRFDFRETRVAGTLVIESPNIRREVPLPSSGGPRAFGSAAESGSTVMLRGPRGSTPEPVSIRFYAAGPMTPAASLARIEVFAFQPSALPLRVESMIPWTAHVQSPRGSWLETAKIFIPGYRAEVNGRRAALQKSPDGLVMIPVPAGASEVRLEYEGPLPLRVAFWISFGSWLLLPVAVLAWGRRSGIISRARRAAAGRPFSLPRLVWRSVAPIRPTPPPASPPDPLFAGRR